VTNSGFLETLFLILTTGLCFIDKSGSWFAYKNTKIGQGRENVKNFLNDNPTIAKEIENQILQNAGIVEKAMMEGKVENKEKEKEAKEAEEIKE
jgi:recombination protein RecA